MDQLEQKILSNIIHDKNFAGKVVPYTNSDYFDDICAKQIAETITEFYNDYGVSPTNDELKIELAKRRVSDKMLQDLYGYVDQLQPDNSDREWLIKNTEKYYQQQSLAHAIIKGATILEQNKDDTGQILGLVQDALAVSFDSNLGHDYFGDVVDRYNSYHEKEDKVSWGIPCMDKITLGGISKKNLVCLIASTGVGKTMMMCGVASNAIRNGNNVLYITLEMSEVRIAERVDANLLDSRIYPDLHNMPLKVYTEKISNFYKACHPGRLIIKEYPTSSATCTHFKALLNDLKLKQGFVPDLIIIDYLNIMNSARYKAGTTNSYGMAKAISEELRGMAVEYNCAVLTATQTNRQGFNNSEIDMTDTSESIGITFVLDAMFALIRTPALDECGQIMVKQLKNRYSDLNKCPTLQLGIDRDKMRVYDLDYDPKVVVDHSKFAAKSVSTTQVGNRVDVSNVTAKNDFANFKF